MLTLAIPKKGEETAPGIITPLKNQRGKSWKQGPQQIGGPALRGPRPGPPDVYWNRGPPRIPSGPPLIPIQPNKYLPQFVAYRRNNDEYISPRSAGVSAEYILPPRGERGYIPQQKPHSETFDHPKVIFLFLNYSIKDF
jgi:hypothetical protein